MIVKDDGVGSTASGVDLHSKATSIPKAAISERIVVQCGVVLYTYIDIVGILTMQPLTHLADSISRMFLFE
jgi:hypothetical protein